MQKYKYNIGDIVNNFIIKERYYLKDKHEKRYQIECVKCHNISDKVEKQIIKRGCSYCNGHRLIKGYNDVATVRPDLIPYFYNPVEAHNVSLGTTKKIKLKCPCCGYIFYCDRLRVIANKLWNCPQCGNRGSFNERCLKSILSYYNIDFVPEKVFTWATQYRYDFYIPNYNCIVELHGLQHYQEISNQYFGISIREQQIIDNNKQQLAIEHNYNYIIIDCKKSTYNYFLTSLKNSNLCKLCNLDYEDVVLHFNDILYHCNSIDIDNCASLYQQGYSAKQIVTMLHISLPIVSKYLKIAHILGDVQYDKTSIEYKRKTQASKAIHQIHTKDIICLETLKHYDTYTDVSNDLLCSRISVSKCCNHKQHFIVSKKDNKQYHVMLYEEYQNLSQQDIQNIINFQQQRKNQYL